MAEQAHQSSSHEYLVIVVKSMAELYTTTPHRLHETLLLLVCLRMYRNTDFLLLTRNNL